MNVSVQNGKTSIRVNETAVGTPVDSAMSAIITQLGNGAASNEPAGGLAEVMVSQRPLLASERAMLTHYLAKKWGLTDTVDSDGDGRTDADETLAGTLAFDATSVPLPDLSDAVNAQIGEVTGLDAVEGNLALWLDASNINGLNNSGLANGDAIAEWTDLSANEFHNTQSNASRRPTLETNVINGRSAVSFDNTKFNQFEAINMNQTMHTFFLVYYPRVTMITNQSGNQTNSFGSISFGTGNKALWFGDVTGALSDELISINSDSPLDAYHGATASVSPEPHLFAIRYTNNKMTIYLDGEVKNTTYRTSHAVPFNINEFILGTNDSGQNQAKYLLNGHVAELILFNDQIDDGFNQVQAYLAKKWGLTATVDSDGDGFTDAIEAMEGTSILDASSNPLPDLSDAVDAQIGEASGLDAVEGNVALWLDASNINGLNNSGMANGDAIAEWKDLSGNGHHAGQSTSGNRPTLREGIKIPFDLMEVMIILHCPTFLSGKSKATVLWWLKTQKQGQGVITRFGILEAMEQRMGTTVVQCGKCTIILQ